MSLDKIVPATIVVHFSNDKTITPPFGRSLLPFELTPPALRFIRLNVHWTFTLRVRSFILKKFFRSAAMQGFFKKN